MKKIKKLNKWECSDENIRRKVNEIIDIINLMRDKNENIQSKTTKKN